MNNINPHTGARQHVLTEEELVTLPELAEKVWRMDRDEYNDTAKRDVRNLMATFEYAAAELGQSDWATSPQGAIGNWNSTKEAVEAIKTEIETFRLEMWISEVIQNSIDAQWGPDVPLNIEIDIQQTEDEFLVLIRHDGRPPQKLGYAVNELSMMLSLGGNKSADFSSIGEFGIGFKIWTLIFDKVTLRHGWTSVECVKDQTISITQLDEPNHHWFEIHATMKKTTSNPPDDMQKIDRTLLSSFFGNAAEPNGNDGLRKLFQRTIHGFRQRDVACSLEIQRDGKRWLHFRKAPKNLSKSLTTELEGSRLIARHWEICEIDHQNNILTFPMVSFHFPFSEGTRSGLRQSVYEMLKTNTVVRERLAKMHTSTHKNDSNADESFENFMAEQASNAAKNVYVGLNVAPDGITDSSLVYSLFELGGPTARSQRFFMFQGRFKTNRERTNFSTGHGRKAKAEEDYNSILLQHCLVLYLEVMKLMTNHRHALGDLGLTSASYKHMLCSFGSGDAAIDSWMQKLIKEEDEINRLLGPSGVKAWPSREDPLSYAELKVPRKGMLDFLNHDNAQISEWARRALHPSEAVLMFEEKDNTRWSEFTWRLPDIVGYVPYQVSEDGVIDASEGWEQVDPSSILVPDPPEDLVQHMMNTAREESP